MKKLLLISYCILNQLTVQSQSIQSQWLRHSCSYRNDQNQYLGGDLFGDAVCADQFGNSYNAGYFTGNQFVMDEVIQMGINKLYINKYDTNGISLWTKGIAGPDINSIITINRMETDDLGNLYICGSAGVNGGENFTLLPNSYPIRGGFIAKYDSNGNNIWCKYVEQSSTTTINFRDMEIVNGTIYLCGTIFLGTANFGAYTFNVTLNESSIVTKLDLNGTILHAELIDNASDNRAYGIAVSKFTNNIYIVGEHLSASPSLTVDGINLPLVIGSTNSFILKMDQNFTAQWLKGGITQLNAVATVGSGEKCLKQVEIDNFDNLYAIGNGNGNFTQFGNLSFNHQTSGGYMQDIYTIKFNSAGVEQWLRYGQSNEFDSVSDIMTDEFGNSTISVISGSNAVGGLTFGTYNIPQWHGGLVKYDPNGNILYVQQLQESRTLRQLAIGVNSVFYGTGTGFNYFVPYINIFGLPNCEHLNGYNPDYKMLMVKFQDNTSLLVNNECVGAISLTIGGTFATNPLTGSILGATTSSSIIPSCQSSSGFDVWYSLVVPASGNVTVETQVADTNSMTNTVLAAFSGTCGSLTQIDCDDDGGLLGVNDLMSKLNLTGQTPGATIYIGLWKSNTTAPNGTNDQFKISAYDASLTTDTFDNANFKYAPNPVKNTLDLTYNQDITSVAVFNLLGQEVLTQSLNATQAMVDMSNLNSGVYLVKIIADQQTKTIKVIKE